MGFLKTIFVTAALGAVGYGVWVALYSPLPESANEATEIAPGWEAPAAATDASAAPTAELAAETSAETIVPQVVTEQTPITPAAGEVASGTLTQQEIATTPAAYGADVPVPSVSISSLTPGAETASTPSPETTAAATATPSTTPATTTTTPVTAAGPGQFADTMQEVNALLANQRLDEALLALSQWCWRTDLTPPEQETLDELLSQLAGTVIYSREYEMEPHYVARAGDTLEAIAESCQVPAALLAKINGLTEPAALREGDKLKIVRGPFDAVADLRLRELTLFVRGRYAGRFPISTGADLGAADGDFQVSAKQLDPAYVAGANFIGSGDPRNPLGKYWLALNKSGEAPGGVAIGIHGVATDAAASSPDGPGYLRLNAAEVADVYDILTVGSRVRLQR